MRCQIGEALHALQEAERIAPEETRVHAVGRAVTRDLLQLSGLRPGPSCATSPSASACCPGRRLITLEGLGGQGGQAERVAGRIGVDAAVVVRLDVVLRGTGG